MVSLIRDTSEKEITQVKGTEEGKEAKRKPRRAREMAA